MDVKALKQITGELSLLYVEDDDSLRDETAKLFSHLFRHVESAENGESALKMLLEKEYDLMITDINMPIMNGVELCKKIRQEQRSELPILITSAHDESHYLLELIDIGINKFILKPLDIGKVTSSLSQVCTHIYNKKLLQKYKQELEHSNIELKNSNKELENLVKILDKKIEQLDTASTTKKNSSDPDKLCSTSSAGEFHSERFQDIERLRNKDGLLLFEHYFRPGDPARLDTLQSEINAITTLMNLKRTVEHDSIILLAKLFNAYGDILLPYSVFEGLGQAIIKLSHSLEENTGCFVECFNDVSILLESFLYVLRRWKRALFVDGIKRPNIYDASMINDIDTLVILLQQEACRPEKNLEFF